jgi:pheromone shutdown-related protein TraB
METERIFAEGKEIVLVGTAHISGKSIELVEQTIEQEKPDVVGVELDEQRFHQLKHQEEWKELDIGKIVSTGQTYLLLLNLLLANMQRQLGQQVGIKPGQEMLQAVEVAEKNKIPVVLLDRSARITLKRAISAIGLIEKIKLMFSITMAIFGTGKEVITAETIEQMKKKDVMSELMNELSREMPSLKKVLVDERDVVIANRILSAPGKKIVAVVGAGHVEGIKKHLGTKMEIGELLKVEKKASILKYLAYIIPLAFVAVVGYLFFTKGFNVGLNAIVYWILINGTLSALGVLIARGHIVSAAVAFVAAPITTLHPLLAAGWFAGLAEAKMRNPKVKDFENLRNLNSFGDFTNNQVTRILLVVAFANIGATIGVVIAFPAIASLFG